MAARKQAVPGIRRPRDVVIEGGEQAPEQPVVRSRPAKLTLYLGDAELAEVDLYRLELRANGLRVDRSRMIRAALVLAMANKDRFERALRRGDGA